MDHKVTAPANLALYELIQALAKCFVIICAGYTAAKFRLLNNSEAKGLAIFVRQFALPALMFVTLATVELSHINWALMKCLVLAKTSIFVSVLIITLLVTKPINMGKAGLYSIFSIQSNDLCLGLPLIESLYKDHQVELSHYLYFLAIVQYLAFNPVGFFLMELQGKIGLNYSLKNLLTAFIKSSILNPIIIMTILGIISNFWFNQELPNLVHSSLSILGAAFSATALFSLGHSLVGKLSLAKNTSMATLILLIIAKILLLPLIIRIIMLWYTEISNNYVYQNFVLIYGSIPTAPTVYIFATQFNMETDVVASGMVASTLLSAPLMFLFSGMTTNGNATASNYQNEMNKTAMYSSVIGAVSSIWVLFIFLKNKRLRSITHRTTACIILAQFVNALAGMLRSCTGFQSNFIFYIQYIILIGGIYTSQAWTASLAFILALAYSKSLCYTLSLQNYITACVCITSIFVTFCLGIVLYKDQVEVAIDSYPYFTNLEAEFNTGMLVILIIIIVCSLFVQRVSSSNQKDYETTKSLLSDVKCDSTMSLLAHRKMPGDSVTGDIADIEELEYSPCVSTKSMQIKSFRQFCRVNSKCSTTCQKQCKETVLNYESVMHSSVKGKIEDHEDGHQIAEHTTFTILLFITMIFSFAISFWKLLLKGKSLLCIEFELISIALNYGQGIIGVFVFGFNKNLITNPCIQLWRKLWYGSSKFILPEEKYLSPKTRQICQQFTNYQLENCKNHIFSSNKSPMKYETFSGKDMVDWLVDSGLKDSRTEAEHYANQLLLGRVIKHIEQKHCFYDSLQKYTF